MEPKAYYEPFQPSGQSFRERVGDPGEIEAALGLISMNFQALESALSLSISTLLGAERDTGRILTSELSFKQLLNVLVALTRNRVSSNMWQGSQDVVKQLEELASACFRMEELRNQYMHSVWIAAHLKASEGVRRKVTAKRAGLKEHVEVVSSSYLLDVADYTAYVTSMLENLYDLPFGAADS